MSADWSERSYRAHWTWSNWTFGARWTWVPHVRFIVLDVGPLCLCVEIEEKDTP